MPGELWSEDRTEALRSLYMQGLSYSQMGIRLGVKRNAIAGKVARLKLPKRMNSLKEQSLQGRINNIKKHGGYRPRLSRQPPKLPREPAAVVLGRSSPDAPPPLNKTFIENDGCKWPVADGLFCGHPRHDHRYCGCHHRMAVRSA